MNTNCPQPCPRPFCLCREIQNLSLDQKMALREELDKLIKTETDSQTKIPQTNLDSSEKPAPPLYEGRPPYGGWSQRGV